MVHRQEPTGGPAPDSGFEAYRLHAHVRTASEERDSPIKRVGQELRDERERQGKQLDDVWQALKIHPNYLAAIEEGRFGDLPGRAFTMGYVARYARYLKLDVGNVQGRLEAELAAYDRISSHRIDTECRVDVERRVYVNHRASVERLSDRKVPVLGVAVAGLLLAALAYSADRLIGFNTRDLNQAKVAEPSQKAADAGVPAPIERPTPVSAPERLPPIPRIAVTRAVTLRPDLLPPIRQVVVTREASLRPELLPPIPQIAVTDAVPLRPELLPPLPEITVTEAAPVRPELLPPLPQITVTQALSLRPELLPPIPRIAVTGAVPLRPELIPTIPQIATARPASAALDREEDFRPEDKTVIRDYVLTVRNFNSFINGLTALAAARSNDLSLARELDLIDRDPAETLADLRAQVTAHPRVFEFYRRQGLTAEDTVLIPLVAGYAAAATAGDSPILFADRISPAQFNFMRSNFVLMRRLMAAYAALSAR